MLEKKRMEIEIERLEKKKISNEMIISNIEEAVINKETISVNKKGSNELKKVLGGITLEKVEKLQDEISDTIQNANDISQILANSLVSESNSNIDDELEKMQREIDKEQYDINIEVKRLKIPINVEPMKDIENEDLNRLQLEVAI